MNSKVPIYELLSDIVIDYFLILLMSFFYLFSELVGA